MSSLHGKIALVAGATRGSGRGIACMLGEAGATVYCSGRSTRTNRPAAPVDPNAAFALAGRPETVEETADLVTARGGVGIAAVTDHSQPGQVRALVERIEREQGRLDILVNDIWGGDELSEQAPFWEHSLEKGLLMLERGIHTHLITSRFAAPLLIKSGGGLIVEVTDGDGFNYRGSLYYDLVKTSVIRIAFAMATDLRPHGVTAVAVTPGFLRSEAMLDHFGVSEATWRDVIPGQPEFAESETPFYIGRAVAALAADPDVARFSGRALAAWDLAPRYGFTDVDGRQPNIAAWFAEHMPGVVW
ncbi:MAG TPA: SDR family oxidoreductase, partial [Herpetosiphonaceae bacterium]|nr:SDR family oxidoreductase [Herpetosiphonaceae bacterium]